VRINGRRTKKLVVAFHFQSGNGAAWRCDECRRQGLEWRRRCGWLREEERGPKRIVWVRGRVAAEECPKSLVTAQSLEWVERFLTHKFTANFAGGSAFEDMRARDADAFLILEREWRDGQQEST
jgi:hypothetical protein